MIFLLATIIITLYKNPLIGILGGIGVTLVAHLLISRLPIQTFLHMVFRSGTNLKEKQDGSYSLKIKGVANFLTLLRLIGLLDKIPTGATVKIDLSKTRLVDFTFQEKLMEFKSMHTQSGGKVQIIGLNQHIASSNHRLALKTHILPNLQKISPRQQRMKKIAVDNGWFYTREEQVDSSELLRFEFFRSRPLETKSNIIGGEFSDSQVDWEISDIVFDEGAMMSKEVYKTTLLLVHLPHRSEEHTSELQSPM